MKKLLLFVFAGILCGCSLPKFSQKCYYQDFSKYTNEGFIISPVVSGFEYEPISNLFISFEEGKKEGYKRADYKKGSFLPEDWFVPDYDFMVEEFVKEAKAQGATGILNFKIEKTIVNGKIQPESFEVSGFAVKIK